VRILVVGSVPPPLTGHRAALLAEVLRLRGEGHDVEIASLDPLSAAHRFLAGPGVVAVGEIGLLARSAEAIVVQLEPGLPVRTRAGRGERTAALMALAAVLRRCSDVTVRLHDPNDLPGGHGGRAGTELWKAAGRIEVGDDRTRTELAALLGPFGERVSIVRPPGDAEPVVVAGLDGWGLPRPGDRPRPCGCRTSFPGTSRAAPGLGHESRRACPAVAVASGSWRRRARSRGDPAAIGSRPWPWRPTGGFVALRTRAAVAPPGGDAATGGSRAPRGYPPACPPGAPCVGRASRWPPPNRLSRLRHRVSVQSAVCSTGCRLSRARHYRRDRARRRALPPCAQRCDQLRRRQLDGTALDVARHRRGGLSARRSAWPTPMLRARCRA